MELTKAIYGRRAVRDYTTQSVSRPMLGKLVDAAIQAPTALDEEAWSFAIIQGVERLKSFSGQAKAHFLSTFDPGSDPHTVHRDVLLNPAFNMFYNAGTLVVIYAKPGRQFAAVDCCLAAENFMLAAHDLGLGTCPIGFAQSWLDLEDVKAKIGFPSNYTAVIPVVVGYPVKAPPAVPRRTPEVVYVD